MVQVIKKDHVAAGLCCIQLFMNSSTQEEAIKYLEHAKVCPLLLIWKTLIFSNLELNDGWIALEFQHHSLKNTVRIAGD